ncbi:MAG: DNA topoisomerase [Bacteroides sp.]|nr:DNA topoisomerase [Bacteroides sp.]
MIVILAEKPSVAGEIARIVGAEVKHESYFEGNGYQVTWAYGHLVSPAMPEDYGIVNFKADQLPVIPQTQKLIPRRVKILRGYKVDTQAAKQLDVLKKLFSACEEIIVATDAGREGELIFRYIYQYLKCDKPFYRLWISSLTDKAIREGMNNLQPGSKYDNLYLAAEARSRADWLIGINASRALCITSGEGNNSLGRVQTPVLAMICQRYMENKNFQSVPYYQILMKIGANGEIFQIKGNDEYFDRRDADRIYNRLKNYPVVKVVRIVVKEVKTDPPLLYDLTELQKDANIRYGFSAEKTLTTAQKLYEKKYITYPRTSSRYLPGDVFETIPALIASLKEYTTFCLAATRLASMRLKPRSVDDKKVTDHHALLITEEPVKKLTAEEKIIYELIAGRMLETYSLPHIKEKTTVEFACDELLFSASEFKVKQNGWKDIFKLKEEQEEPSVRLPSLKEGDYIPIESYNMVQLSTKPKPLFTEASLLAAMEMAGNLLHDKEKRAALKGIGLGTPATRSSIIETLLSRQYILRDKKHLIPTKKGLFIYNSVKDMRISDVLLTATWEQTLSRMEADAGLYPSFIKEIEEYTHQITDEILSIRLPEECESIPSFPCPRCKIGKVLLYHRAARCKNRECDLNVSKEILGKTLTIPQLNALFRKGKTPLIKGFTGKKGKFDAILSFDENFKLKFIFDSEKKFFLLIFLS